MKLNTPLWFENARDQRAQRDALSNKRHRTAFPWLLAVLAIVSVYVLVRYIL